MIDKEKLRKYSKSLMFDMQEGQYETLQDEFDIILKQMSLIENIPNISDVEPMTFPYVNSDASLREDEVKDYLTTGEVLLNVKYQVDDQVKLPKVVD